MKRIVMLLLSALSLTGYAQDYQVVNVPVIESGNYGDSIVRKVIAGPNGATFRFLHSEYQEAFWNEENLFWHIINSNGLNEQSSDSAIVMAVATYLKRGGIEAHIGGYSTLNELRYPSGDYWRNWTSHPLSVVSVTSKLCGEYSAQLNLFVRKVTAMLGISPISVLRVSWASHQANEYWDSDRQKWVYVDVDPGSEIFMPMHNGASVSATELFQSTDILFDTTSLFLDNSIDAYSKYWSIRDMQSKMGDTIPLRIEDLTEPFEPSTDIYYTLLPYQEMRWDYLLTGVYVENNDSAKFLMNNIRLLILEPTDLDSTAAADSIDVMIQSLASIYDLPLDVFVEHLFGGKIRFGNSRFFGKDLVREQTFSVEYPSGYYTNYDVSIPHIVKAVNGSMDLQSTAISDFSWNMYSDFEETYMVGTIYTFDDGGLTFNDDTKVTFYGNDRLQLVPELALFEGDVTIENWNNGVLTELITSVHKPEQLNFSVYPNPTSGSVRIDLSNISGPLTINVFNTLGRLVRSEKLQGGSLTSYEMPESAGVYLVQLVSSDRTVSNLKVVKE